MNNYHLNQTIENLRMFSNDVASDGGPLPDANNIFIYNY